MKRPIESDYTSLAAYTRALEEYCDALAQTEQEPVAWMVYTQDGQSVYVTDNPTDIQEGQRALPLYTYPPPLTDVIKSAQGVLESTEIAHRPPVRDRLEVGRMVRVRLHALADLSDALAAHGIKENT